jgi:hypothetical protein
MPVTALIIIPLFIAIGCSGRPPSSSAKIPKKIHEDAGKESCRETFPLSDTYFCKLRGGYLPESGRIDDASLAAIAVFYGYL